MLIYLVRHAIAYDPDYERWPDDSARPLTKKGIRSFQQAALGLAQVAAGKRAPQIVLSSPFVRAWQTAEILAACAGWPEPQPAEPLASGSPARGILALLEQHAGAPSLALVGHEPVMSELCALLLTGRETGLSVQFKKGAVACLEMGDDAVPGSAQLHWYATPKLLRAAGKAVSA